MRNSSTADQNTFYRSRYIHGQMSSPTSQIIVHHIMRATRVCRPPHPNGILSSTIQTGWALFSINTTPPAIHTHLISRFACKQSTFHSVKGHNRTIKSRSGDGSRHLGMWRTIVLHISWSTVTLIYFKMGKPTQISPTSAKYALCTLRKLFEKKNHIKSA